MGKPKPWKGKRGPRPEGKDATPADGGPAKRDKGTVIRSTAPKPAEVQVPRKLTDADLVAHTKRAARLHTEADDFEEKGKEANKRFRADLKKKRAEISRILREVSSGVEMVGQGDLFVDGSTPESRANEGARIAEGDAMDLVAEIATRAGDGPELEDTTTPPIAPTSGAGNEAHA